MMRKRKPVKLPKNHRDALDTLRHMLEFRVRKRWRVPNEGLEFTIWLFPKGSQFGGGGACMPCAPRVKTTTITANTGSSATVTWLPQKRPRRGEPPT